MKPTLCVFLGGGGHARVLIDCLRWQGDVQIKGILDEDLNRWGQLIMDVLILGGDNLLPELVQGGVDAFVVGLGGTANNQPRQRLFEWGLTCGIKPLTVIGPNSYYSSYAEIGPGCQLMPGSIVNAGARLGQNVIVNSSAVVEHDCVIGDHVHIATGAKLASTVHVGDGAHIGAGAVVRQCVEIGSGAVIGMGAVVIDDVEPDTVVAGVPARVLRRKSDSL